MDSMVALCKAAQSWHCESLHGYTSEDIAAVQPLHSATRSGSTVMEAKVEESGKAAGASPKAMSHSELSPLVKAIVSHVRWQGS